LYACLPDFIQNLSDIAIPCASIGSDINLPVRAISYAFSNLLGQVANPDFDIAIGSFMACPLRQRVCRFFVPDRLFLPGELLSSPRPPGSSPILHNFRAM